MKCMVSTQNYKSLKEIIIIINKITLLTVLNLSKKGGTVKVEEFKTLINWYFAEKKGSSGLLGHN